MEARSASHPPQRFSMVDPATFWSVGATFVLMAGWLLYQLVSLSAHGQLERALEATGSNGRNGLVEMAVVLLGVAIAFVSSLYGRCTVVTVSAEGIGLERWGKRQWLIPWSEFDGWRWEREKTASQYGRRPLALCLLHLHGRNRRLGLAWYYPSRNRYQPLLEALQQYAPLIGERPDEEMDPPLGRDPVGVLAVCLVLIFITAVAVAMWWVIHPETWGLPPH